MTIRDRAHHQRTEFHTVRGPGFDDPSRRTLTFDVALVYEATSDQPLHGTLTLGGATKTHAASCALITARRVMTARPYCSPRPVFLPNTQALQHLVAREKNQLMPIFVVFIKKQIDPPRSNP